MEFVDVLRILWDRRILVALGIIVAVAAGLLVGRASPAGGADPGGVGTVRMVLDTADSQLVEAAPKGADTLAMRAALLANAMATDTGASLVARTAAVADEDLVVLGPAAKRTPMVETPLVKRVAEAAATVPAPYLVDVSADDVTPIISIEAHAPDVAKAERLTQAAVAGLRSLLTAEDGSNSRGFVLDTVAPLRVEASSGGSRVALRMLVAALATFAFWCVGIAVAVGTARRMRRLGAQPRGA